MLALLLERLLFPPPPPFNRDLEGESIVVGDSSMGAVDSKEEKAGGVFHSSSIALEEQDFSSTGQFSGRYPVSRHLRPCT